MDEAYRTVEAVARDAYGRLVSYLAAESSGGLHRILENVGVSTVEDRQLVPGPEAMRCSASSHSLYGGR